MGFGAFSVWSTTSDGTCKCGKGAECPSPGKHPIPRDGFNAASRDPKMVTAMMSAGSEPNYGIVWPEDGDVVFSWDIDGPDWKQRLADLSEVYGPLPKTKTTKTPHGGLHLYYRWPQGVTLPKGNHLHGFIVRWPMKGYVVGPGSRINGKVYTSVGTEEIATLPPAWAVSVEREAKARPLITVTDDPGGYVLPDSVPTGGRHDAITAFVASRWNRGLTKDEVAAAVRDVLAPRFNEAMDRLRLDQEIDHAWDTCEKGGWQKTFGETKPIETQDGAEITPGFLPAVVPGLPVGMATAAITPFYPMAALMDWYEKRTDASIEGLTVTSLTYLSALVGHKPSVYYGSKVQHTPVYSILVGPTGIGRKGTTTSMVREALTQVTEMASKMKRSPNSGEGVINLANAAKGDPVLIEEEEFDRLMTAKGREGSTLSHILRQAFDGSPLSSVTSSRILMAEKHHIALLGNVTREEIAMSMTDVKSGFANRMLWTAVTARPGHQVTSHDPVLDKAIVDYLRSVIEYANLLHVPLLGGTSMRMDDDARAALEAARVRYSAGVGIAPYLSRRLDVIAARLSMLYALMDLVSDIALVHAEAAIAVTDYAHASASWVFPETTGDTDADLVLRYLREAGGFLSSMEIEALVGKRAKDKQRVVDALGLMGYARPATRPRTDGKPGRPRTGLELT